MVRTPSELEERLARLVATSPPPARPQSAVADPFYLSEDDQERLQRLLAEVAGAGSP